MTRRAGDSRSPSTLRKGYVAFSGRQEYYIGWWSALQLALMYEQALGDVMDGQVTALEVVDEDATTPLEVVDGDATPA